MSSFSPFILRIFWGGEIVYEDGVVTCDESTKSSSFPIREKFSYEELVVMVYNLLGVSRQDVNLSMLLAYEFQGVREASHIHDDGSLGMLFFLAETQHQYWGNIYVKTNPIIHAEYTGHFYQEPEEETYPAQQSYNLAQSYDGAGPSTGAQVDDGGFDGSDDYISPATSEDDIGDLRFEKDDSDEEGYDEPNADYQVGIHEGISQAPVNHDIDTSVLRELESVDVEDDEFMIWNEKKNHIEAGMYFKSKDEVMYAVRNWNIKHGKEIYVQESRPKRWRAICKTNSDGYVHVVPNTPTCNWLVSATRQGNSTSSWWRIVKWVAGHNCYGSAIRNNNTSLTSKNLASCINHAILADITYPVKNIMAYCKEILSVDCTYIKAWRARRIAIENIYGNWESNFQELPKYINALKRANPKTVVEWRHHVYASPDSVVFKYVFWAFGPSIEAFRLCRPVISIDGTHLKGSYVGKMLIAVSKDANGYIIPLAYAIVDEETNESWSWFLEQFGKHVRFPDERSLCVISDRHKGIINAMNTLEDWMEPKAYHRYCLRHIRSNFMSKFKSVELKRLCWGIGCTSQPRKYRHLVRQMRDQSEEAWNYLKNIRLDKWTIVHDDGHRRWGNLTTNISESMNNALRGCRLLPIKAIIQHTFDKTVQHFRKHREIAVSCNTGLPPRIWGTFNLSSARAREHTVAEFSRDRGIYKVTSRLHPNNDGGNEYTVEFTKRRKVCSCFKWQTQRLPCSHAIAVFDHRGVSRHDYVHKVHKTKTYRNQYDSDFYPLAHPDTWREANWSIRADPNKLIVGVPGRKKSARIHNEMDAHHPEEAGPRCCSICRLPGHNMLTCRNGRY
jgi:hypothetical protein